MVWIVVIVYISIRFLSRYLTHRKAASLTVEQIIIGNPTYFRDLQLFIIIFVIILEYLLIDSSTRKKKSNIEYFHYLRYYLNNRYKYLIGRLDFFNVTSMKPKYEVKL